jgi:hypothetical protein
VEELSYHDEREEIPVMVLREGGIVETVLKLDPEGAAAETEATEEGAP